MNFDKFNPLSKRGFSSSSGYSGSNHSVANYKNFPEVDWSKVDKDISDWGIEDTLSQASRKFLELGPIDITIPPTTENFQIFIKTYLKLNLTPEFWEKFKYNLIISNLLDDSMILSKNEQSLKFLNHQIRPLKGFNHHQTQLFIERHYMLKLPIISSNSIIIIIGLIIELLKLTLGNAINTNHWAKFKILLILSTKYIKFKRIKVMILMNKNLNLQRHFLINNFKINLKLIKSLLNLKQMKLFKAINYQEFNNLINSIHFLKLSLSNSIGQLLPLVNGDNFEKYYKFNHLNLDQFDTIESKDEEQELLNNINYFNTLRKLLICQLLTLDEKSTNNYLLLKMFNRFNVKPQESHIMIIEKLTILSELLNHHNNFLTSFLTIFERFTSNDVDNEDILKGIVETKPQEPKTIDKLIERVNVLATNLKYFKQYNESIEDDEKRAIFNQYNNDINNIHQLYKLSLNEFETPKNFNLKSFHTKRFSDDHRRVSDDKRLSGSLKLSVLQQEMDNAQRKRSNRYSVNSMNSNLSGLSEMISSKVTSFDEIEFHKPQDDDNDNETISQDFDNFLNNLESKLESRLTHGLESDEPHNQEPHSQDK